jgi:predicted Zn-dependent peptidase
MLLTVCGDTDIDTVMSVVDRVLPKTVAPLSVEREYPDEDEKIALPYTEHYMSVSKPLFAFGCKDLASFKTPEEKVKHGILAEMLGKCYFSRSAPFFNRLYDDRLVSSDVQYSYDAMNSCAYLMISGESENPKLVYEKTLDLLKNISENLPPAEDFLRIKRVMYANFVRTFDSTEDLAYELTSSYFHGTDLLTAGEIISSLTYEEFIRFASSFFEDKAFALSVIYPIAQKEGA